MKTDFTESEEEILLCLIEDCTKLTNAITRMLRFGKYSRPPGGGNSADYNFEDKFGQLQATIKLAQETSLIRYANTEKEITEIIRDKSKYLIHNSWTKNYE